MHRSGSRGPIGRPTANTAALGWLPRDGLPRTCHHSCSLVPALAAARRGVSVGAIDGQKGAMLACHLSSACERIQWLI